VAKPRRRVERLVAGASALVVVLVLALWVVGCWRYTSIGIDRDRLDGGVVHTSYARIRWPGDGSLWFGGGRFRTPAAGHTLEPFDLAATLFQPPRRVEPRSAWNSLGFWRVQVDDAAAGTAESWIGVPGWLPALVLVIPWLRVRMMRR
jgi:hypothetical protein